MNDHGFEQLINDAIAEHLNQPEFEHLERALSTDLASRIALIARTHAVPSAAIVAILHALGHTSPIALPVDSAAADVWLHGSSKEGDRARLGNFTS